MARINNSQPMLITMCILVFNLYTNSFRDRWKFVSNVDLFIPLRILCSILHLCFLLKYNYETNNKQIILLKIQYSHDHTQNTSFFCTIPLINTIYNYLHVDTVSGELSDPSSQVSHSLCMKPRANKPTISSEQFNHQCSPLCN